MKCSIDDVRHLANLIDEVCQVAIIVEHGADISPDESAIAHRECVSAVYHALVDTLAVDEPDEPTIDECAVCFNEYWFDPYGTGCYQIPCPCREERNGNCRDCPLKPAE
jgi:hypothetical protein